MEVCEFLRRADILFHATLGSYLFFTSAMGLSDSALVNGFSFSSTVIDLIILSFMRFKFRMGKLWPIVSIFYIEIKLVFRLLTTENVELDDFLAICIMSFAMSIARFIWFEPLSGTDSAANKPITWKRLFRFSNGHWGRLITGLAVLFVRLPFSIAVPHYVSEGIGSLIDRDPDRLKHACVSLFVVGTLDAILDFWCVYLFSTSKERIISSIRQSLFRSILLHPLEFFDKTAIGELQSRLNGDTADLGNDLSWVFRFSFEALVRISGVIGYMLICSWRLTLVVLILIPFNAVANTYFGQWMSENSRKSQDLLAVANTIANESFSAVQTVKSFHGEQHALDKYVQALKEHRHLQSRAVIVSSTYYMVVSTFLMSTCIQTAIVAYGGYLAWHAQVAPERLVSFLLYLGQLQHYTSHLMTTYVNLVKCANISDKLFSLINGEGHVLEPASVTDQENDRSMQVMIPADSPTSVEFQDVTLIYATRPSVTVLNGVSFKIPAGSCTGIVGHSGSGKSSVLSLLLRLYSFQSGRVLINSTSVDLFPLKALRGRIMSIVSQEPILFRGTLRDNVLYSLSAEQIETTNPETLNQMISKALKIACISDFISNLPDGLDTKVGDRGVTLSGGQKQRIAIARAIISNPPILLLDEAMSALDPESEGAVQKALNGAMKARTTIMVSHRISTVIDAADHCVVMHKGKVVEEGNPKKLLLEPQAPAGSEVSLKILYEIQQKYIN